MKKLLISAAGALVCTGVFAVVEAANTLCRIQIDSSRQETLLSIPLKTVGGENNTIDITKYVLTQGLKAGDKLMKRTNGEWESWTLDADNGQWVAGTTISGDTLTEANAKLAVGDVIALYRANPSGSFYLYGELPANISKEQTASAGVWTMMGNAKPAATTLATIPAGEGESGFQPGDRIYIPTEESVTGSLGMNVYYYAVENEVGKWKYDDYSKATTQSVKMPNGQEVTELTGVLYGQDASGKVIPAGRGFWYVRAAGKSDLTVTW